MAASATCLRTTALSQGLASSASIEKDCSVQRSAFLGAKAAPKNALRQQVAETRAKVACMAERSSSKWASLKEAPKETKKADRWGGLGNDQSDDQQDIARGRGMVDSLFQGKQGLGGTQNAIMSSYDYISTAQRTLSNISREGYYISPSFMDKLVIHITKNFLKLPNIKVPLILGVWGGKGQGKSFQAELVFAMLGINPIVMSAGELESGNAGEPAKLIRQRYREAADIIKKGKMCALFINDLDAGAGRMGGTTQYTVNNQMVNATLMNIADNPNNVQLPGVYNKEENPRVPIIVTGNDFSTLYAPLIRDGRMEKFYWAPTREDRIGVCTGIFKEDKMDTGDITKLVDTFPGQSIDFFGALRSRVYDDLVREWVDKVGYENLGKSLVNNKSGPPSFEKPQMTLNILLEYGNKLVEEQDNVKRVQFAEEYLSGAALGDANADAIASGSFYADGKSPAPSAPKPSSQQSSFQARKPAERPTERRSSSYDRPAPAPVARQSSPPPQQEKESFWGNSAPKQESSYGSSAPQQKKDSFFGSYDPPQKQENSFGKSSSSQDLDNYRNKDSFWGSSAPQESKQNSSWNTSSTPSSQRSESSSRRRESSSRRSESSSRRNESASRRNDVPKSNNSNGHLDEYLKKLDEVKPFW